MSKLQDSERVACWGCGYIMDCDNINFCKNVSEGIHSSIKYQRRCNMVVCTYCEYCESCKQTIERHKQKIRNVRNHSRVDFEREKQMLLEHHGVKYNIEY